MFASFAAMTGGYNTTEPDLEGDVAKSGEEEDATSSENVVDAASGTADSVDMEELPELMDLLDEVEEAGERGLVAPIVRCLAGVATSAADT